MQFSPTDTTGVFCHSNVFSRTNAIHDIRDSTNKAEFSICYEICFFLLIPNCHLWTQVTFEFECGNIMCFCAEILPKNCNFLQFFDKITQSKVNSTIPKFHAPLEEMIFLISLQLQSEKAFSLGGWHFCWVRWWLTVCAIILFPGHPGPWLE